MEQRQLSLTCLRYKRCAEYRGVRHASFAGSTSFHRDLFNAASYVERPSTSDHLESLQGSVPSPNGRWRDIGRVRNLGLGEQ